ncbi:MAG: RNA-directed DNA polymerase [Paracoccaceae bacterium]
MGLKQDLLGKGYLPENMPPAFTTKAAAAAIDAFSIGVYLSQARVRPAVYSASKRGMTRRQFSFVHPQTAHDNALFISSHWDKIEKFFDSSGFSESAPRWNEDSDRALEISPHSHVEVTKAKKLSAYRFIATTDISRFYHSIYTHSIPWAFHGKKSSKADNSESSKAVFFNRADFTTRRGQDGQTIGIPVGPDTSRVLAEVVSTAIDVDFASNCTVKDFEVVRHVDDVWIGTNTHADAERALSEYRGAIRQYELDINESKTKIFSSDFRFSDDWPTEIASKFDTAISSRSSNLVEERLRAAFEHAFALAVHRSDDAILKYAIRYIDRGVSRWAHWSTVEPFLKRAVVHYGHSIDYVARVLIWRQLVQGDVDTNSWSNILNSVLQRHAELGNDSEVCWATYACLRLNIKIDENIAKLIVQRCGPMSLLAILNSAESGIVPTSLFNSAKNVVTGENARGAMWPILLEWKSRKWPNHGDVEIGDELIGHLVEKEVTIFDPDQLTVVFSENSDSEYSSIGHAIEKRTSMYDEDEEDEFPDF